MEYYSALVIEVIMPSEASQSQKEKYCMIPFIGGSWNTQKHQDQRWNGDFQVLRAGGIENYDFNGYKVSVLIDEKLWRCMADDGCTIIWAYLIPFKPFNTI